MGTKDLIGGGLFAALGVFIFFMTLSFPSLDKDHPGPGLFPTILAVLFVIFGGVVFIRGLRPAKEETPGADGDAAQPELNYFNPIFVLFLIVGYMVLSDWLGFLITSWLVMFFMMMKLRVSFIKSLVLAILFTLFVNLMFTKVLRVPLPPGLLRW